MAEKGVRCGVLPMKNDLVVCLILAALFIATMLLVGQRDQQLASINARIDLIESQVGHGNIPRITVTGRTSIYSTDGEIVLEEK